MRLPPSEVLSVDLARAEQHTSEFRLPDWSAPIDLAERLHRVPAEHTIKGMFIQWILEEARAASGSAPASDRYAPFQDYPLREWIELLVGCVPLSHPQVPVREGLRRFGQRAYAMFAASVVGQVLVGVADQGAGARIRLLPRIYRIAGRAGNVDASFPAPHRAIVHLRDVWDFPDAYHVGVCEGGLRALGVSGQVKVRMISQASADLDVCWHEGTEGCA
jgi:uncharacterized protein (TIGR02265 family)